MVEVHTKYKAMDKKGLESHRGTNSLMKCKGSSNQWGRLPIARIGVNVHKAIEGHGKHLAFS